MSDAAHELVPGRHLRKNQKQILAAIATAVRKSGLEWSETPQGSTAGIGRVLAGPDGAALLELRYEFGHAEIHLDRTGPAQALQATAAAPSSGPGRAVGLYTDTHPL